MIDLSDTFLPGGRQPEHFPQVVLPWAGGGPQARRDGLEMAVLAQPRARRLAEIPDEYREPFDPLLCRLPERVVAYVQGWEPWNPPVRGVGLVGPAGRGKTRLLVDVLQRLPVHYTWLYLPELRLARAVMDRADEESRVVERGRLLLDNARTVQVLLLDDVGEGWGSPACLTEIQALVAYRTARALPILWTSNLSLARLESRSGARGRAVLGLLQKHCWMA
jgi:hypothetical protein